MLEDCLNCQRILQMTRQLDKEARDLTKRVAEFCGPVRIQNNLRLEEYAKKCRNPILGWLFRRWRPQLTQEPFFRQQYWFKQGVTEVEKKAFLLEAEKQADQPHWDQERVTMRLAAKETTRLMCYKQGERPRLPDRYDFTSREGSVKLVSNRLVVCEDTSEVRPAEECVLLDSGKYRRRKPTEARV